MIEVTGNLWTYRPLGAKVDARVIATNGMVNNQGEAVMGKGSAYEAASRFPGFERLLGERLRKFGNRIHVFSGKQFGVDYDIITYPTKNDWRENSDLDLITSSAVQLVELADNKYDWGVVIMPRVGSGAGNLRWDDVKRRIQGLLDDRFLVITFDQNDRRAT